MSVATDSCWGSTDVYGQLEGVTDLCGSEG